jgi:hypothetical protein
MVEMTAIWMKWGLASTHASDGDRCRVHKRYGKIQRAVTG